MIKRSEMPCRGGPDSAKSADPLFLPAGQLPGPDVGIGDPERARRLLQVLDQIDDELARAAAAGHKASSSEGGGALR